MLPNWSANLAEWRKLVSKSPKKKPKLLVPSQTPAQITLFDAKT
jgi:hypothetical protein